MLLLQVFDQTPRVLLATTIQLRWVGWLPEQHRLGYWCQSPSLRLRELFLSGIVQFLARSARFL